MKVERSWTALVSLSQTPPPPSSPIKTVVTPPTVEDVVPALKMELSEQQKAVKQMVLDGKSGESTLSSKKTRRRVHVRPLVSSASSVKHSVFFTGSAGKLFRSCRRDETGSRDR